MSLISAEAVRIQAQHGLPEGVLRNPELVFAPSTRTIILSAAIERDGAKTPQVFVRNLKATRYRNIIGFVRGDYKKCLETRVGFCVGVRKPVIGPNGELYVLFAEYGLFRGSIASSFLCLGMFDLASRTMECWDPRLCAAGGCAPVGLMGADEHGVYAKAGFKIPLRPGGRAGHSVEYAVVHLRWAERRAERVAALPRIFY